MTIAHFDRTEGVDPRLVQLFEAIAAQPGAPKFGISEGLRDIERQRKLLAEGKSQTLNSKHLHGGALDIHLFDEDGNVTWDYPLYQAFYDEYAAPMAAELGLPMTWGGNWKMRDGVHYQLDDVTGDIPSAAPAQPVAPVMDTLPLLQAAGGAETAAPPAEGIAGLLERLKAPESGESKKPDLGGMLAMAMASSGPQAPQIAARQYTPMHAPSQQQDAIYQHNAFSANLPWMQGRRI